MIKPLIGVALFFGLGFIVLKAIIQQRSSEPANIGIQDGALKDCPDTPNCITTSASRAAQKIESLPVSDSDKNPIDIIAAVLKTQPEATIEQQDASYLHVTFKTRLLNFTDDVEFYLPPNETDIQMRSASRLGKYDFGANKARVERLRELLVGKF